MISLLHTRKQKTLGETYKHINDLLKDERFDPDEFIKYNPNLNAFEKKVQGIYIDTFRIKEGVVNGLLSNDVHLVRRILKCDWFFEGSLTPKEYKEKIFPKVSLSTRCKIINKLSRHIQSEHQAEELFSYLDSEYGSRCAEIILPRCSYKFVSDYINNVKPEFKNHNSEKILIKISERYPDLIISYLQRDTGHTLRGNVRRFPKLVRYLAKNRPRDFLPMFEKLHSEMGNFIFGKKSTKSLKSELLKVAEKAPILTLNGKINNTVIFRSLNFDEQKIFLKLVVEANSHGFDGADLQDMRFWSCATPDMIALLKQKPRDERPELVKTTFKELYGEDLADHPETWSFRFLEMLPLPYRDNLVKVLQKRCDEDEVSRLLTSDCMDREREAKDTFVYLANFRHAFGLLSRLMETMTKSDRREILLTEMVRSAILDRDPLALETVIAYITQRHHNEEPRLLYFLLLNNVIHEAPLKMMSDKVWSSLEKFATVLLANLKEKTLYREVLEGQIAYSFRMNSSVEPVLKKMIKTYFVTSEGSVLVRNMNKSYSRDLIIAYYKEIFSGDEDYAERKIKDNLCTSLLLTVNNYNNHSRRNRIKIEEELPLLVEHIDKMVGAMDQGKKHVLNMGIFHNRYLRNKYAGVLLRFSMKSSTLYYLMKHHPEYVKKNLDKIIGHIFELDENEDYEKFFTSRCRIDFLDWLPILEKTVRDLFTNPPSSLVRVNALRFYSHLCDLQNFRKLVHEYIPSDERLVFDDQKVDFHELQIMVPELVKNVKPDSKNWKMITHYLSRDYIRWVLPSVLSFAHNSGAEDAIRLLKSHFQGRSISVKKVILRCVLDLSSNVDKFEYCKSLWEVERNPSFRGYLFKCIMKRLSEDATREVFDMVATCLIEGSQTVINDRLSMNLIPPPFLGDYAQLLWQFTETCENKRFVATCRKEIINHFNLKNISLMKTELCQKILDMYLFQRTPDLGVDHIARAFLLRHPETMDSKTSYVIGLMRKRKDNYTAVKNFIQSFKDIPKDDPTPSFAMFDVLLEEWPKIYGSCKMFKEYLLVKYVKAYSTAYSRTTDMDETFGEILGKELRQVVTTVPSYSNYVNIFNETLADFVHSFHFDKILGSMLDKFLGTSFGVTEGIIAINLLPSEAFQIYKMSPADKTYNYPRNAEVRRKYNKVLKRLLDKDDTVLKVFLNLRSNNEVD